MRALDDAFNEHLRKMFEFSTFVADTVEDELKKSGVQLTREQKAQLTAGLKSAADSNLPDQSLNISIDDAGALIVGNGPAHAAAVMDLKAAAESRADRLLQSIGPAIGKALDYSFPELLEEVHKQMPGVLRGYTRDQARFARHIHAKWQACIDPLEAFIWLCEETGAEFNRSIRSDPTLQRSPRFEMLSRSHARSCQIALEILALLKNGFADGAHARWRTLHEIATEMAIIRDGDDDLAARYLDHDAVQRLNAAKAYQAQCGQLGYEPISDTEMQALVDTYEEALKRYGRHFKEENGWAAVLIGKRSPKFSDLEAIAKFGNMRPFYKLACSNVHGGVRGILFRLGLSDEQQERILLAGPSDLGLAEPIQNAAYSLLQTTVSLLNFHANLDYLVSLKVLFELEKEIFAACDEMLHREYGSQEAAE